MNKRQKLIQEQFLNNEQTIIKRLQKVYDKSLQDINEKISNLTFTINDLKLEYSWMDDDDPEKAKVKSMIQSKIYQREYQQQLRKQVDGILKRMDVAEFTNISDYLDTCYEDGYIGGMFDLHGQGVPIIAPINQEAMVRAVQLESKISKGLYTRLGEDVNLLKRKIMAQVSRSISTGMTYAQTAKALEGYTRIGYNNAIRIARTEGHRVQTTATMDAMTTAKSKGADVVKQWDATLDGRTRESHSQVDGEIRELNEHFSNGLDFPGDPGGGAAEVINCRCAILQRARWALGEDELQTLKDKAEYFGLDKIEQFDDFKKKYLKVTGYGLSAKIWGNGIPEHEEPKFIKSIKYADKKVVSKELQAFENDAVNESVETACVITTSGNVYHCFGLKDRVFPDFDLKDKLYGATISHNHPIDETMFTFSSDDLELFLRYDLEVLRGCDKKYIYEFTKDASQIDDLPDDWMNIENFVHAMNIEQAKKLGIGYRRWLNE